MTVWCIMKVSHCLIQDHWVAGGLARSSDHLKLSYPRDTPQCVVSVVCRVHNLDTTTFPPPPIPYISTSHSAGHKDLMSKLSAWERFRWVGAARWCECHDYEQSMSSHEQVSHPYEPVSHLYLFCYQLKSFIWELMNFRIDSQLPSWDVSPVNNTRDMSATDQWVWLGENLISFNLSLSEINNNL